MIPIYVNHYHILTERKEYLQNILKKCEWMTYPSRDEVTQEMRDEWYLDSPQIWNQKNDPLGYDSLFRSMTNGDIACSLGHILGWKSFIESGEDYALFLEDDVVIEESSFEEKMSLCLNNPPSDLDVLFVGGGFEHDYVTKTLKIENSHYHLKAHPATNCACSYILTKTSAQKLYDKIKPFTMPIDFELNYWFCVLGFNVYHYIPYFVQEGSKTGKYSSTQTTRK